MTKMVSMVASPVYSYSSNEKTECPMLCWKLQFFSLYFKCGKTLDYRSLLLDFLDLDYVKCGRLNLNLDYVRYILEQQDPVAVGFCDHFLFKMPPQRGRGHKQEVENREIQ